MKRRMGLAMGAGGLLFLARWADLIFWTDPATGLCTVGSVWWRYGGLALACGLALWAGQKLPGPPEGLWGRHPAAAGLSRAAGEAFLLAGAARALTLGPGAAALLRAALEALCGVWLFALGRSWSKEGARPTRSMGWAVAGSALFYWTVLERFMKNSSSWHRAAPTAEIWRQLAALVFLAALARALYLPGAARASAVGRSGLLAFCLCLCWGLPRLLAAGPGILAAGAEVFFELGVCLLGLLGGGAALLCGETRKKPENAGQNG